MIRSLVKSLPDLSMVLLVVSMPALKQRSKGCTNIVVLNISEKMPVIEGYKKFAFSNGLNMDFSVLSLPV